MTWVRAEYLFWSTQGMRLPPMVTTGPNASNPGYLDTPGTTILNGNDQVDGYGRSGLRLTLGTWLNPCQTVGIEGDYFQLATATSNYNASGSGNTILSRPFFDTRPSLSNQNVEQIAFPDSIQGSVGVNTYTTFLGAGARLRFNLCCSQGCFANQCLPGMNGPGGYRLDLLLGYRYLRLADGVSVTENLTSLQTNLPGTFYVVDSFKTVNQFNGIDFGALMQVYRGRWSLELIYRLALGNTNQLVTINGSTTTTQNGTSTTVPGGLLTQSTNIGQYDRNTFGVVPELDANIGFAITPRLRLIVGYTFIYWSSVARAGSQIDTNVNSTLLPNSPNPPSGSLTSPQFTYHEAPSGPRASAPAWITAGNSRSYRAPCGQSGALGCRFFVRRGSPIAAPLLSLAIIAAVDSTRWQHPRRPIGPTIPVAPKWLVVTAPRADDLARSRPQAASNRRIH